MTKETDTTFRFSPDDTQTVETILAKYPEKHKASALMPLLDLAQRRNGGWLTTDHIDGVCDFLGIPRIRGHEVATFYTMYNHAPKGRFHIQVCTTTPCWLRGSDEVVSACKKTLGIDCGQTTEDGLFGLSEVECLGACVNAPVVQINDDYFEDLDANAMTDILEKLARGQDVRAGSQKQRQGSAPLSCAQVEGETPLSRCSPAAASKGSQTATSASTND